MLKMFRSLAQGAPVTSPCGVELLVDTDFRMPSMCVWLPALPFGEQVGLCSLLVGWACVGQHSSTEHWLDQRVRGVGGWIGGMLVM